MAPEYRAVEGRLYALGRPPEARPSQPHPQTHRPSTSALQAQGTPPREVISRLDLTFAVRQLPDHAATVILEHYITGVRMHRGQDRRRAIETLLAILEES